MQMKLSALKAGDKFFINGFTGTYCKLDSSVQKQYDNFSKTGRTKEYYYSVSGNISYSLYASDDKFVELVESAEFKKVKLADLKVGEEYYVDNFTTPRTKVEVSDGIFRRFGFVLDNKITMLDNYSLSTSVWVKK